MRCFGVFNQNKKYYHVNLLDYLHRLHVNQYGD